MLTPIRRVMGIRIIHRAISANAIALIAISILVRIASASAASASPTATASSAPTPRAAILAPTPETVSVAPSTHQGIAAVAPPPRPIDWDKVTREATDLLSQYIQ